MPPAPSRPAPRASAEDSQPRTAGIDQGQQWTLTSGWGLLAHGTGWWRLMHQERGAEVAAEGGGLWRGVGQREGTGRSQPLESLAFPKPKHHPTRGTSPAGHSFPHMPGLGASASHLCVVPTHRLAWALLVGDRSRMGSVGMSCGRWARTLHRPRCSES